MNKNTRKRNNKTKRIPRWAWIMIGVLGILAIGSVVFAVGKIREAQQAEIDEEGYSEEEFREAQEKARECMRTTDPDKQNRCLQYLPMSKKPIIYLYPEKETEVSVTLGFPELLTTDYPEYNDGWRVLARPDGSLTDLSSGKKLYALYWEGEAMEKPEMNEGFVVEGKKSAEFLEEKLTTLGLSDREMEEFIIYWLPKLEASPYNLVRFETREEIEKNMPLDISPTPKTTIRIMMDFKPLENPIDVPEQILPETPARDGFTVVEWGGSELE